MAVMTTRQKRRLRKSSPVFNDLRMDLMLQYMDTTSGSYTAAVSDAMTFMADTGGVTANNLCYVSGYDSATGVRKLKPADANGTRTYENLWLAIATVTAGNTGSCYKQAVITAANTNAGTVGDPVYLSETPGAWTLTKPSGASNVIQIGTIAVKSETVGVIDVDLGGNERTLAHTHADAANGGTITLADGTVFVGNVSNEAVGVTPTGDVTITNAGVMAIASGVIVNADVKSNAAIDYSKLAAITAGSVIMGNASTVPTVTAISGDVTVGSTGVAAIGSGVIIDADINASAAISYSKLAGMTAGYILMGNASALPTVTVVTGDVLLSSAGVTSIASGVIINADVKSDAAIDYSKLATMTAASILLGNVSNVPTVTAVTGDVTISNAGLTAIASGVIVNDDISGSAAIAASKLATTVSRNIVSDVTADPGAGQAIPVTASANVGLVTAGGLSAPEAARTLADGTFADQTMTVSLKTKGTATADGNATVTAASAFDGAHTTATLATVGDSIMLRTVQSGSTFPWRLVSAIGAALSSFILFFCLMSPASAATPVSAMMGYNADGAVMLSGRFVKYDANGNLSTASASTDAVVGVTDSNANAGKQTTFTPPGMIATVRAGAAWVTRGTLLVSDANGCAIALSTNSTSTQRVCGYALSNGGDSNITMNLTVIVLASYAEQRRVVTGSFQAGSITDGNMTIKDGNIILANSIGGTTFTDGNTFMTAGTIAGSYSIRSTTLTDGNVVIAAGAVGGATSVKGLTVSTIDGNASMSVGTVTGKIITDGNITVGSGVIAGAYALNGATVHTGSIIDGNTNTLVGIPATAASINDPNNTPSIPFVFEADLGAGNTGAVYTVPAGRKVRVVDVVVYKDANTNGDANNTVTVYSHATDPNFAITNAISQAGAAYTRAVPATINAAYADIAAGGKLAVITSNVGISWAGVKVRVWCIWIAP